MGEVVVVAPVVEALAVGLGEVEDVFEEYVDDLVEALAEAPSERGMAGLEGQVAEEALDVREDAQVLGRDRGVAFELRVAERKETERRKRSRRCDGGCRGRIGFVYGHRRKRKVQLDRLEERMVARVGGRIMLDRRQRKGAFPEEGEEI